MGKAVSLMPVVGEVLFLPEPLLSCKKEVCNVCSRPSASAVPWQNREAAGKEESCSSSMGVHGLQVFTLNRDTSSLLTTAGVFSMTRKKTACSL